MHVAHLRLCAVKGTRHVDHEAVEVTASGIRGDREYALVDPSDLRVLTTVRHPRLTLTEARVGGGRLGVRLPDGTDASQPASASCPPVTVTYWGRPVAAVPCPGRASDALAGLLGRPAVLVRALGGGRFLYGRPVGVWFTGDLAALGRGLGTDLDPRRFRLAIGLDGAAPEDPLGCTITVGSAVLRVEEAVQRCPIVDWDVGSATPDLAVLARLRADGATPVFGFGCSVLRAGGVRAGDGASLGFRP